MRLFTLILLSIGAQTSLAQLQLTKLDKSSLPKGISYQGKIHHAVKWTDNTGDHIVLLTTTDKTQSKNAPDEGYSDGALHAYHFLVSDDSVRQTWSVYDFVKECPVDMFLHFIDNTLAVTDLNKDGKAEVWMMYKRSCQGDVSPVTMKVIMYENNRKFAARGTTRVQVSEKEYSGGSFTFDEAFKHAPAVFRQYAEKLWAQHKMETWQQ